LSSSIAIRVLIVYNNTCSYYSITLLLAYSRSWILESV